MIIESVTTKITAGASFMPDSASRIAESRGLMRSRRRVEKTAAASVDDSTAPYSRANCQDRPSRRCSRTPTTATLTTTPTVASMAAAVITGRTTDQRVVRPPSAMISTSAQKPRMRVRLASSNWIPSPDSPMAMPISR